MTEPLDGWTERVDRWGTVTYEHRDDSTIAQIDILSAMDYYGKWALYVSDPPRMWDAYETPELAKAAHAEGEWREHMRGTP